MQLPRGKLLALVAMVVALAMVTSTMAGLSGIMSHRTADVRVVSDYDAYLQMVPADPGVVVNEDGSVSSAPTEYDPIAYYDELGHLALRLDRVNSNSTSWFDTLFTIQNTQDEELCVWINDEIDENEQYTVGEGVHGYDVVSWYVDGHRDLLIDSEEDCVWLAEGDSITVGAFVNSFDPVHISGGVPGLPETGTQLLQQIHVEAESFKDPRIDGEAFQMVHASEVLAFNQGSQKDGDAVAASRSDANNSLGAADSDFVSLGFDGNLTVGFGGPVYNTVGEDGLVVEVTLGKANYGDESADVYAVTAGGNEIYLGTAVNKDPIDGPDADSTVDSTVFRFTLPPHVNQFVAITVQDTSDPADFSDGNADGYDIDAIRAYDP